MKSIVKIFFTLMLVLSFTVFATAQQNTDAKSAKLLNSLKEVNGGWQKLAAKKDVQYTYVYNDFTKGTDLSTERYIFDGEASWAEYKQHEANVMPGTEGTVKQSVVNGKAKITLAGKNITDQKAIEGTQFMRSVNFFWFAMMYKLDDPGTVHKYLGQEMVNGINYDKVQLTYNAAKVGKEVNDEYILYFNPNTHLVDRFFFSLPAMGVNKPVLRMDLEYSKIKGVYIATERKAFAPNEKGEYNHFLDSTTKDIKFNNKFKVADFEI